MGYVASKIKWFPLVYIIVVFVAVPAVFLGLSYLYEGSSTAVVFGILITLIIVAALARFIYWWHKMEGKEQIIAWVENYNGDSSKETVVADYTNGSPTHTDYKPTESV